MQHVVIDPKPGEYLQPPSLDKWVAVVGSASKSYNRIGDAKSFMRGQCRSYRGAQGYQVVWQDAWLYEAVGTQLVLRLFIPKGTPDADVTAAFKAVKRVPALRVVYLNRPGARCGECSTIQQNPVTDRCERCRVQWTHQSSDHLHSLASMAVNSDITPLPVWDWNRGVVVNDE